MRAAPLPSSIKNEPFSTTTAGLEGVSRARLRRTDLARPFHGVRIPGVDSAAPDEAALTLIDRCSAFATRMDAGHFFSHTTAAAIYGLPLPQRHQQPAELHVSVIIPRRAPKAAGIVGHKLRVEPDSLRFRAGLRVPAPAEVWCELAALLTVDELVQAGDAVIRRTAPLAAPHHLATAVAAAVNRPGIARLREALPLLRARTDSPMETLLRLAITRAGLPEPEVNFRLVDSVGSLVALGDLVYPAHRVIVEYDGDHHRSDAAQYASDVDREWKLESLGWRVVRVNRTHMADDAREAVRRIRLALR